MVNRSVTWADWNETALVLELQEIQESDFDLSLTGFDPGEIDGLLALEDEEKANAAPPLLEIPVSRRGDLWLLGPHRVLCGDATSAEAVARLLGDRKPRLMVTDPPYGIELDSEWRDRAGLNGCGPAEPSYMKKRTRGHTETTIFADTIADWSHAFELVRRWRSHTSGTHRNSRAKCIGFLHHQQIIWNKGRTVLTRTLYCSRMSRAGSCERRMLPGTAKLAKTAPSGIRHRRSSSWAAPMRRNTITRHRNLWNSCGARF